MRPAAAAFGVALLLGTATACAPGADSRSDAGEGSAADSRAGAESAPDPFPAVPPDGPLPEIGPAPADYRPTAAAAPSTDIWIGRLDRTGGTLSALELINVTDRDGYDNQPAFDPDGGFLYYTSAVDSTQTEVFRRDLATGATEQVTRTPGASEFSPTFVPGQDAFSAIRETRGKQYLWRYSTAGDEIGPVFSTVEPVGYHAWADERRVVAFVLGDPPTLHVGDAVSGAIRVVAENPGRSIHRIPDGSAVSFVRKATDDEWWIERLDPATGATKRLARTLAGREDFAWTPEGEILMSDGETLHAWTPESGWTEVELALAAASEEDGQSRSPQDSPTGRTDRPGELSPVAGDISRITVSADGVRIALVRGRSAPDRP